LTGRRADDRSSARQPSHALDDVLDRIAGACVEDGGGVRVGTLVASFGRRGYGALLLLPALIEISPIGGVPGVPSALALVVALFASVWLLVAGVAGRGAADGEGTIAVREATLRRQEASWLLDLRADIELSPEIRAGLDSGVPLEFVLELELNEPRRLLPDAVRLEAARRYELTYYELTQHYRVRSVDDGGGRNYRSLPAALDGLGTLRGVELGGLAPPLPLALDAELVLHLDQRSLPLPLQSLVGAAWRLDSGRHAWRWTTSAEEEAAGTERSERSAGQSAGKRVAGGAS